MSRYAEVLLPLPLYSTFTYHIPDEMTDVLGIGCRVLVPFGRKKFYTAIVTMIHGNKPEGYEVKDILTMLDDAPIVRHPQLKLWEWISEYYLCPPGDVYKAAVPSGLKVESETFVSADPDYEETSADELTERERIILDFAASRDRVQLAELSRATGFKNVEAIVSRMLDKGAVFVAERVVNNYRPLTETCVTLACNHGDDDALHHFFDLVGRSKKQEALLLAFLDLSHWLKKSAPIEVVKKALLERADAGQSAFKAALDKGIFRVYKKEINRFASMGNARADLPTLSDEQSRAFHEILDSFRQHAVTLLHGVTSSGKTAVYMHIIAEALRLRKQVLYLVPEIALTTQLTKRLQRVFGNSLLIYHSKFSDNERVDIWKRLLHSTEPCVVIGVRSSVFLPFSSLGLVIVDEEHDASYKQQDPAPRYNGRNVAMVLAQMHGAKTLLGSATPAIESYYNATTGKYGLVSLLTRYEDIELPSVEVIDTKLARKKREMTGTFTGRLLGLVREAVKSGNQAILFQNRRGYAPMVTCKQCGWVPKCENCDVSLTYHKHLRTLSCHYCGFSVTLPDICPACKQPTIEIVGYGTERIEDDIDSLFPESKILRMDLDTTRNKNSYERIIDDFSSRKADILVGTQMVTKGLDFERVSVVGILDADGMLSQPDFRSHERAFQMMEQVAGRAGRKGGQGHVILQTRDAQSPVVQQVVAHDYQAMYEAQMQERELFNYPPLCRLVSVYVKHRDERTADALGRDMAQLARRTFGERVLGPDTPPIGRIQLMYIRKVLVKIELTASMSQARDYLRQIQRYLLALPQYKGAQVYYDVD